MLLKEGVGSTFSSSSFFSSFICQSHSYARNIRFSDEEVCCLLQRSQKLAPSAKVRRGCIDTLCNYVPSPLDLDGSIRRGISGSIG